MQNETFTIEAPKKAREGGAEAQTFAWSELTDDVQRFIVEYGLKQILGDAISGVKDSDDAASKIAEKANALREGTVKMTGGGKAKSEIEREAEEILAGLLKQAQVANLTEARKLAKDQGHAVRQLIAKQTGQRADKVGKQKAEKVLKQVQAKAEQNVKARQIDVDLGDDSEE